MTLEEIEKLLDEQGISKEEKIRIIRKARCQLLEEIHCKQQLLDQLDYLLCEIKKDEQTLSKMNDLRKEILR